MTGAVSIRGSIEYVTDGSGRDGVEHFRITRFAGGCRQLRATSEMDNDELVRDTFLVVDSGWRPRFAHVNLTLGGEVAGSGHYVIDEGGIHFRGWTETAGLCSKESAVSPSAFGGHALQNDAWMMAAADVRAGDDPERSAENVLVTSRLPNGADGPDLLFSRHSYRYIGDETVTTPAGRFATRHFAFHLADKPPIHYWTHGADYLLVRCRWDFLRQSYILVELQAGA